MVAVARIVVYMEFRKVSVEVVGAGKSGDLTVADALLAYEPAFKTPGTAVLGKGLSFGNFGAHR